jgi:AraC-like DNA-binding protein
VFRQQPSDQTIRAAGLQGFRRLAGNMGGDPDTLLRAAGINPTDLDSPDNRISYAAMIQLLESCAEHLRCPDFGLRLSGYQDIDILGPAALIAHYSDTVGDSLKAIANYVYIHSPGVGVQVVRTDELHASLTFEVLIPGLHAQRQINELSLSIGQSLIEMLLGQGFRCDHVQFTHRRPDDLLPLMRRFGRSLSFGRSLNALTFPVAALSRPVPTANAEFRSVAIDYVRDHLGGAENNRVRRIVLLVHQLLPTGRCSLRAVSDVLSVHPSTLQRELRDAETDFRGIVDRTRRELVADHLLNTDATLTQVAAMLGYGDQAAFTNAFRRWYGVAPGQWRRRQRTSHPGDPARTHPL